MVRYSKPPTRYLRHARPLVIWQQRSIAAVQGSKGAVRQGFNALRVWLVVDLPRGVSMVEGYPQLQACGCLPGCTCGVENLQVLRWVVEKGAAHFSCIQVLGRMRWLRWGSPCNLSSVQATSVVLHSSAQHRCTELQCVKENSRIILSGAV